MGIIACKYDGVDYGDDYCDCHDSQCVVMMMIDTIVIDIIIYYFVTMPTIVKMYLL